MKIVPLKKYNGVKFKTYWTNNTIWMINWTKEGYFIYNYNDGDLSVEKPLTEREINNWFNKGWKKL